MIKQIELTDGRKAEIMVVNVRANWERIPGFIAEALRHRTMAPEKFRFLAMAELVERLPWPNDALATMAFGSSIEEALGAAAINLEWAIEKLVKQGYSLSPSEVYRDQP